MGNIQDICALVERYKANRNYYLTDRYNEELSIAQGLISENKDLKLKLKNAKMENTRIKKGGTRTYG